MTTIAISAPLAPAPKSRKSPWKLVAVVFMTALFSGAIGYAVRPAINEVPLKPCLTCPTCTCPKALGGVKCLCAK